MEAKTSKEFVISRIFDAPRTLVWKVWTEADQLKQWWGPKGFKVLVSKMDLRPGGKFHYCIEAPDGMKMWGKFLFQEISAPERLVFISSFSDEQGGTTRHPMNMSWPLELMSTILFEEENGKTKVTVKWMAHNATADEQKTFDDNHTSMQMGWGGTFEQLAGYMAKVKSND